MHVHTATHRTIRDLTDPTTGKEKVLAVAMGGICMKKQDIIKEDKVFDEVTGLSQTEKDLILKSWHKITEKESLVKVGVAFFLKAFTVYPYLQDYFTFLSEKSASVTTSVKFKSHVLRFMYAVTAFVENLDDHVTLLDLMTKISEKHILLDITYDDMQRMSEVFLEFIQDMLGKDAKSSTIVAWKKLFSTFLQTYANDLKKDASKQRPQLEIQRQDSV